MTDPATPPGKRCTGCGLIKPLDEFHRDDRRPDGRKGRCRTCSGVTGVGRGNTPRHRPDPGATEKRCTGCGLVKPVTQYDRRAASYDGLNSRCKDCRSPGYTARQNAPPKDRAASNRERANRHGLKLREAVFAHYGVVCACCGSTDQPTIDHINGGGAAHRDEVVGRSWAAGTPFYRWLIAQGFPEGFQTLCKPCNASKANHPACRLSHGRVALDGLVALLPADGGTVRGGDQRDADDHAGLADVGLAGGAGHGGHRLDLPAGQG